MGLGPVWGADWRLNAADYLQVCGVYKIVLLLPFRPEPPQSQIIHS